MKNYLAKILATGLGVGFSPLAPGTCGSLWGCLIFYAMRNESRWFLLLMAVGIMMAGIWAAGVSENILGKKDAQQIVIDEVAGQLIAYLFIPFGWFYLIIGFVLFRFFDITKIFPARWAQDHLQDGWGVMGDDVVAGLQAALVLYMIHFFYT